MSLIVIIDSLEVRREAHECGVALEGVHITEAAQISANAFMQALRAALVAHGWKAGSCDSLTRKIDAWAPSFWKNSERRWSRVRRVITGHVGKTAFTLVACPADVQALVLHSHSASAS